MAKQRPSLEAFAQAGGASPTPAPARQAVTPQPAVPVPPAKKDRPHTTLYLDRKVQRAIKEIALQYDLKAHDLYLEGINLMLAQYGRPPIDELIKK